MPFVARHRLPLRLLGTATVVAALIGGMAARSDGDLQSQITAGRSAAGVLRSAIAAETSKIQSTSHGVQDASRRLAALEGQLARRQAQLASVQSSLIAARDHLVVLENRLQDATHALAANLVSRYEGTQPDLVSVILDARGFTDLLEKVSYLQRMSSADAHVVGATRVARTAVAHQANALAGLEVRDRGLADAVLSQRNQVAALRAALLGQQLAAMRARSSKSAQLAGLQRRLNSLERQAAAQAARAAASGNAAVGGIAVNTHGMVQAPAGAPAAVAQVIAAGNAIATLPYVYGGGHASFHANGYDCSGSVSYALAAAGLVSSPMVSGAFESWGDPGPGRWITVYANAGHVWMEVAGWRFDTVALATGGTRWAQGGGEFAGFVVRHPPGL
jgi:cell wall-associated NlpC family hydrolase